MRIKRILIINNGLSGGGIERASVSLAHYFIGLGYNVNIVALYKGEHFFVLDDRIEFNEPDFSRESINKFLYLIKMILFLRMNVTRMKPDVILAFSEWTNPFVVLATLGLQVPLYLSDRMSPMAKLPLISSILRKLLYKKASGIIAQTEFAKEIIFKNTAASNIQVIYNPVNCIQKSYCAVKNRIVSVGRLSKEKGHKNLVEAFASVTDKTWELSLVGDGTERVNLELLANRLGIGERVIFHGHLRDFTIQLSEAKIFVLPSLSEGFPNALIEAMSLPLACISSNCLAGPNEIIEDGVNGLLVEPGNINDLAVALNRLIEHPDLRENLAVNAYKVRETLSFEKIAHQYLDFIFDKNG
ncbi:MAG: glycosyltransferase [Prolixibacteraceae bacterium]|jgi:glycosyltransferase involved in cell wall biosynthesis|nr:glycosyltransferase [Prolixibacteraceae bacterium]